MTSKRTLTGKTDYGIEFAEVSTDSYVAYLDGSNLADTADYTGVDKVIGLKTDGTPEAVPVDNFASNIHFYLQAGPDQAVTTSGDYCLVIPVGAQECESEFAAGNAGVITIMGVSLCAGFYSGTGLITGSTTIRISNKAYLESGASNIDCTLTATSADTDRRNSTYGSITVNTTSQALYVHFTAVGGHGAINGWIWLRRESGA